MKGRNKRLTNLLTAARKKWPECKEQSDGFIRGWLKVASERQLRELGKESEAQEKDDA
jgi:hypothetical protein